jgi:hypothetical protein
MTNLEKLLTRISQKLQPLCITSEIFPPDETNNFHTLAVQFEGTTLSKLKFDCNVIPGPEPTNDREVDLQILTVINENLELEYLRDVIWTNAKVNFVMPFGHFGVITKDRTVYWKYTLPINLSADEEVQAESFIKRIRRCIEYIEIIGKTVQDVSTGKSLPSEALKKSKWAQYF